jgi:hypothetical protein
MTMPVFEKKFTGYVTLCEKPFGIVNPVIIMTRRRWIAINVTKVSGPETVHEVDPSGRLVVRPPRETRRVGLFDAVRRAPDDVQDPAPPAADEAIPPWTDAFRDDLLDFEEDYPVV